jgi:hypothetical protein
VCRTLKPVPANADSPELCREEPRYARSEFEFEGATEIELTAQDGAQTTLWPGDTGWKLYDPQLEKFLDPVEDAEAFGIGVGHVQRIAGTEATQRSGEVDPSLWRRLFSRE